jgi:hypothetical protein
MCNTPWQYQMPFYDGVFLCVWLGLIADGSGQLPQSDDQSQYHLWLIWLKFK